MVVMVEILGSRSGQRRSLFQKISGVLLRPIHLVGFNSLLINLIYLARTKNMGNFFVKRPEMKLTH